MQKILLVPIILIIAGCATRPMPTSAPPPCDYRVGGKCKTSSASDISGNTTLGHHNDEDLPAKATQP